MSEDIETKGKYLKEPFFLLDRIMAKIAILRYDYYINSIYNFYFCSLNSIPASECGTSILATLLV